jgi:predicted esterase
MRRLALVSLVVSLSACSDPGTTPPIDAAVPMDDAYAEDAFVPPVDVGPDAWIPTDAGAIRTTPTFPSAAGACPDMTTSGTVMVHPSGIPARSAQIWVSSAAATMDGPLVLVWHGAGGSPSEAPYILGMTQVNAILAAGGIVIAPSHDPANTQLPWFLDTGSREDDLFVADELVACARAAVGFDEMHVHSVGFSAGALHTAQMSFRRASYLASVVTYSGGLFNGLAPPPRDAMDARFAAMILYGGPDDVVLVSFDRASHQYLQALQIAGDFGFVCNHGMGHTVPPAAQPSAWQFLQDHPYGMTPHAYADGLPSGFYAPCALP